MSRTLNAIDRLNTVTACIEAVSDLMIPEPDLHAVCRDKQAVLLAFLVRELMAAQDQLNGSIGR